jgi:hypothetical protein
MSRQIKISALIVFLLAVVFYLFFDRSKHVTALEAVNSFGTDPYDAVGSFGIQLAIFAASLTILRAFRPYCANEVGPKQIVLILRGLTIVVLSVAVTLTADGVALARYRSVAMASVPGLILTALVAGLALLTILCGWLVYRAAESARIPLGPSRAWTRAIVVCLASVLILAAYPAIWDQGIPGGILAALLGMAIFVLNVWILAINLFPKIDPGYEDLIDDLVMVYQGLRSRAGMAGGFLDDLEKLAGTAWLGFILSWLNPRKHAWNLVIFGVVVMGAAITAVEATSEGASPNLALFAIVASVFIGIESAGILLSYILLSEYLGLFRTAESL